MGVSKEERRAMREAIDEFKAGAPDIQEEMPLERLLDALDAAEVEKKHYEFHAKRFAGMILRLPKKMRCTVCPHKDDKHDMNCMECCPVETASRIVN